MWIVRLALMRPYTFTVMALLLLLTGIFSWVRMAKDIFPSIDIPVVTVVWTYGGMQPSELEKRVVLLSERTMTTTVNDIEHIESQTMNGIGVIKVFLYPGANIDGAVAQVTASNQTVVRLMPPGMTPPLVIRYSASNVPVIQLALGSKTLDEKTLYDLGTNYIRPKLATVQGAAVPSPHGGKVRQIQIDINPGALQSYGITPAEVAAAVTAQNLTLPTGTAKVGDREYGVQVNSSPEAAEALGNLPVRTVNGTTLFIRDVAHVRDGSPPQTNLVRRDGVRGALIPVLKSGDASTLDVIENVKSAIPKIAAGLPAGFEITPIFDQSVFVKGSLEGVIHEGVIAAALTALMLLLFLGNWRGTLVATISIPLSILAAIILLKLCGQTINIMTLGGLALAVGILVDNATVTIENIDRNLAMGKPLIQGILDGAQQISTPAFVATLCICIVFVPIFFLTGAAKYLFGPLAMAVLFSILASYLISRTIIPTFLHFFMKGAKFRHDDGTDHAHDPDDKPDIIWRIHVRFNRVFNRLRDRYVKGLEWSLDRPKTIIAGTILLVVASLTCVPFIGRDYFPAVDAGQFRLHVRTPAGTRIEETERSFARVESIIRQEIPAEELSAIVDDIGLPPNPTSVAFSDSVTSGPSDGEILVSLNKEKHAPTAGYVEKLRRRLSREMPDHTFFTQPADIVGQILNFGLPAPIDVQISVKDPKAGYALAREIAAKVAKVPGAVDVHIHQVVNSPTFFVEVDRTRAQQQGLSERSVATNLLVSLAGSGQTAPNYWLDMKSGVQYPVVVQTPQYRIDSPAELLNTPVSSAGGVTQTLAGVATIRRGEAASLVSHYNVAPVFDVFANVQGADLGFVSGKVKEIIASYTPDKLPKAASIKVLGQSKSMNEAFIGLGVGLVFAIVFVYLLMAVNFQSWTDPLIIIMALAGALAGVVWALVLTGTNLSVPAFMGAIMGVGVATANSILMVNFANDQRPLGFSARAAMIEAGRTRLRPVMMTAIAMIIGMIPMALGLGDGGEQNAPLGRVVIGSLLLATVATLILVPVVYMLLRKGKPEEAPEAEIRHEMTDAHMPEKGPYPVND